MKNLFKIVFGTLVLFSLTFCSNQNAVNSSYPERNSGVYKTNDGNVYRQGKIYRDKNGTVYENGRILRRNDISGQPGILNRNQANTTVYRKNLPPGQGKKILNDDGKNYRQGQNNNRSSRQKVYKEDASYKSYKKAVKRQKRLKKNKTK